MTDWNAADCIHLHACRRLTAMAKHAGLKLKRNCTKEDCTAYVDGSKKTFITAERAAEIARDGHETMRGYDPYDVYAVRDFEESTLNDLIQSEKRKE